MRITLTRKELEALVLLLYEVEHNKNATELIEKLCKEEERYLKSITTKKRNATKNANKTRSQKSLKAIKKAITILKKDNKKITCYSISKAANISYTTARRHEEFIIEHS